MSQQKYCSTCKQRAPGKFCKNCGAALEEYKEPTEIQRKVAPNNSNPTSKPTAKPKFGGGSKCVRCKKTVYEAEKKLGPKGLEYHQSCFSCVKCKKPLNAELGDHNGEIYCLLCHANTYY
jgi:cysteine/glycine-rich protein